MLYVRRVHNLWVVVVEMHIAWSDSIKYIFELLCQNKIIRLITWGTEISLKQNQTKRLEEINSKKTSIYIITTNFPYTGKTSLDDSFEIEQWSLNCDWQFNRCLWIMISHLMIKSDNQLIMKENKAEFHHCIISRSCCSICTCKNSFSTVLKLPVRILIGTQKCLCDLCGIHHLLYLTYAFVSIVIKTSKQDLFY